MSNDDLQLRVLVKHFGRKQMKDMQSTFRVSTKAVQCQALRYLFWIVTSIQDFHRAVMIRRVDVAWHFQGTMRLKNGPEKGAIVKTPFCVVVY